MKGSRWIIYASSDSKVFTNSHFMPLPPAAFSRVLSFGAIVDAVRLAIEHGYGT